MAHKNDDDFDKYTAMTTMMHHDDNDNNNGNIDHDEEDITKRMTKITTPVAMLFENKNRDHFFFRERTNKYR